MHIERYGAPTIQPVKLRPDRRSRPVQGLNLVASRVASLLMAKFLRDVAGIRELTSLIKTDQLSFKSLRQNN